ncbi:unnamed protein product [Rhodiola kirilowii]
MRAKLNWGDRDPFHVIPMVYREWRCKQKKAKYEKWSGTPSFITTKINIHQEAVDFKILLYGGLPPGWESSLPTWSVSDPVDATRGYSEKCLNQIAKVLPGLIGGSADLATSNKAYLHEYGDFLPDTPWGRNIRYGVREHAMAGISNGIALHGSGLIPFAATFLIFSDYMKNSIRLSALSHAGVIYILTHDSIGLGEDGSYSPASRAALWFTSRSKATSVPTWRRKRDSRSSKEYKDQVLPPNVTKRVSVEAGSPMGWREYVGAEGVVIGVDDFGTSGAYLDTFEKYGFTEENVTREKQSYGRQTIALSLSEKPPQPQPSLRIDTSFKVSTSTSTVFTRNDFLKRSIQSEAEKINQLNESHEVAHETLALSLDSTPSQPPTINKNPDLEFAAVSDLKPSPRHDLAAMFTCKCWWCAGCNNLHLLADRLGWFGQPGSIEDLLAARGEEVKKGSVDTLSLTLEELAGTKSSQEISG